MKAARQEAFEKDIIHNEKVHTVLNEELLSSMVERLEEHVDAKRYNVNSHMRTTKAAKVESTQDTELTNDIENNIKTITASSEDELLGLIGKMDWSKDKEIENSSLMSNILYLGYGMLLFYLHFFILE